jgi:arsenate reductase
MTTLYGLKNCDTCRKAITANPDAQFVDIRTEADLAAKVPHWLEAVGVERLVNTKSTTWRGLSDADKAAAKAGDAAVLVAHPALIKRPVIEDGDAVTVGWPPR